MPMSIHASNVFDLLRNAEIRDLEKIVDERKVRFYFFKKIVKMMRLLHKANEEILGTTFYKLTVSSFT